MTNIFTLENVADFSEKLNMDDLYETKQKYDLNKLTLFNKILNRIHVKIKTTSKQKINEQFCWYVVPEIIIGVPRFDQASCIAFIMDKLKENGFNVRYFHPNTLFICWNHWVPTYVRTEFKKKTGIAIDQYGNKIGDNSGSGSGSDSVVSEHQSNVIENNPDNMLFKYKEQSNKQNTNNSQSKKFTPINSYKPTGNLIYNNDLLNKIEEKFTNR